jgi:methylaspartate ammonia-lyase
MNMNNLADRFKAIRYATYDPHAHRMCIIGYLGAMLELNKISSTEYIRLTDLSENAYLYRYGELNAIKPM